MRRLCLCFALFFIGSSARADEPMATRPVLQASWKALGEFAVAPLGWTRKDLRWLLPVAGGTVLLWGHDVKIHRQLAKDEARRDWLDASMPVISTIGEGWSELSLVLLAYGLGNERLTRTSGTALQALAVVGVFTEVFKTAAWSNRPYEDDTNHRLWAFDQSSRGMPSGHTFSAFALAEVYGAEYGRPFPYLLAGIMGYSRIYNHAHWASDVWVGAALGIAAGHLAHESTTAKGAPALRWSLRPGGDSPLLVASADF